MPCLLSQRAGQEVGLVGEEGGRTARRERAHRPESVARPHQLGPEQRIRHLRCKRSNSEITVGSAFMVVKDQTCEHDFQPSTRAYPSTFLVVESAMDEGVGGAIH